MIQSRHAMSCLLGLLAAMAAVSAADCFAKPPASPADRDNRPPERIAERAKEDILSKKFAPTAPRSKGASRSEKTNHPGKTGRVSAVQTVLGLAFVLCLIWVTAAWAKKHLPNARGTLPSEAVQILGQKVLGQRQTIQLIRCGARILIVGSTAQGLTTLSEITDPVEVDYLAGLCRQEQSNSVTSAFSQLFQNYRNASPTPVSPSQVSLSAENNLKERLGHLGRADDASSRAHAISEQAHG